MAIYRPQRVQAQDNAIAAGNLRGRIVGVYGNRYPTGTTEGLGFAALPFAIGAGVTTFGSNVLDVTGYNTFALYATTSVAMGLVVRHVSPLDGTTVVLTEAVLAGFAAGTASVITFGRSSANLSDRVWSYIQIGINNATAGSGNVTALGPLVAASA